MVNLNSHAESGWQESGSLLICPFPSQRPDEEVKLRSCDAALLKGGEGCGRVSPPRPPRRNPEGRGHSVLGVSSWPCTTPNTRHGHSHAVTHSARPVAGGLRRTGFEWGLRLCCAGTPWALRGFESDSSCRMPHQCDGGRESLGYIDGFHAGTTQAPAAGLPDSDTPTSIHTVCCGCTVSHSPGGAYREAR